jgi:hypothetical protein
MKKQKFDYLNSEYRFKIDTGNWEFRRQIVGKFNGRTIFDLIDNLKRFYSFCVIVEAYRVNDKGDLIKLEVLNNLPIFNDAYFNIIKTRSRLD